MAGAALTGSSSVFDMTNVGGGRRWAALSVLCVTLLLISLDNTILNVALPSIVRSLHATSSQLQWIVDAYAVVFAGLLLTLGALGDRVGRKWVFMAGLVVFGGGSALAAWSGSPDRLTVARAVMGVGAAALMPCTLSILTNVFTGRAGPGPGHRDLVGDHRYRGRHRPDPRRLPAGPLLVGFGLPDQRAHRAGRARRGRLPRPQLEEPAGQARRPGRCGAVDRWASACCCGGSSRHPNRTWTSPLIVGALAGSAVIIAAFVVWERRIDHPMLPLRFFSNRRYSAAIALLALVLFALLGMFFLMTQYLQFCLGFSPLKTGLAHRARRPGLAGRRAAVGPLARRIGTKRGCRWRPALDRPRPRAAVAHHGAQHVPATVCPSSCSSGSGWAWPSPRRPSRSWARCRRRRPGSVRPTSDTSMQIGGALGVAVLGTALTIRYQDVMTPLLAHRAHPGQESTSSSSGSLGGALAVAQRAPGALGEALAAAARRASCPGWTSGSSWPQ